ncbi:hypothetical protein CRG98_015453 [Punica granatum]|uniref:Uncharacterized protein n=1 Tax=Punica granatum TaxID=22663 RepID=A0A2I0K6K4_PUNGR|nr:hypothetical protein CRG98_015453 [Punica granatum]
MERNGSTQIDPGLQPDSIVGHTGAAVTPIRLEVVVPALNKQERTRNLCRETSTTFVGSAWTVDQFRKLAHASGGANGNVRTIGWIVGPDLVLVQQLVVERLFAYPLAATSNWLLKMYMRKLLFTKFLLIDDL